MEQMRNKAMQDRLNDGTCLDVSIIGEPLKGFEGSVWILHEFMDGVDYCDAERELWIQSIGKHKQDGRFYASIDYRMKDNPLFDLVWFR
jgi:hypothetical protein